MGRDARYGAELLIETLGLPLTVEQYLAERRTLLFSLFENTEPIPGAIELVEKLQPRLPLAIATSSSQELCAIKLNGKPWVKCFSTIVFGDDIRVRKLKPAPDIFLLAAEELKVPASACLAFEDSPAGVEAAIAAGMQVVAVPDPRHDRRAFAGATSIVDGYHQLALADFGL
jgi:pseudouridine-5'-monophosphatase